MMKLNWVCVDDQPFRVLLSNSISNSLPIIIYVFTSLMFGTCASRRWRSSLEFAKLMSLQCKRMRHKHHSTLSTPTPKLKVYDIGSQIPRIFVGIYLLVQARDAPSPPLPVTSYDLAFSFFFIYEHFGLFNYFGERFKI